MGEGHADVVAEPVTSVGQEICWSSQRRYRLEGALDCLTSLAKPRPQDMVPNMVRACSRLPLERGLARRADIDEPVCPRLFRQQLPMRETNRTIWTRCWMVSGCSAGPSRAGDEGRLERAEPASLHPGRANHAPSWKQVMSLHLAQCRLGCRVDGVLNGRYRPWCCSTVRHTEVPDP